MPLDKAKRQVGSFWSYLYPKKEDIQRQLIDVDKLIPKIDLSNATESTEKIKKMSESVAKGKITWQKLFDTLPDGEKHFAKLGQQMEGQIITTENVTKANQQARSSALAHNEALKAQTLSAKAGKAVLQTLVTVCNLAASYFISTMISGISNIITANNRFLEKAKELGNQFVQEKNSIEDYKNKIKELHSTINDNSSSFEEVTQARVNLMGIQDELIEKFGTEKNTIDTITDAIDGQSDALDRLTKKQYLKWKNDFNDKDFGQSVTDYISSNNVSDGLYHLIGFEFEEALDAFTRPTQTNIEKMVSEMRWVGFDIKKTGNEVLDSLIEDIYNPSIYEDTFHIYGENLSDVYKDLISIQELASNFEVSERFESSITKAANAASKTLESYKDNYDTYVLYEKILYNSEDNQYDEQFNLINKAKEKYDKARKSGDKDKIKEASDEYAKTLQHAIGLAIKNNDTDVADYFKSMYPTMQEIFGKWEFYIDFKPNINGIKDKLINALDLIDGTSDGNGSFSIEDILNFNPGTATEERANAYGELLAVAEEYEISIKNLLTILQELGLIQSENYQQLVEAFGKDNVDRLSDKELEIAYTIKNIGNMTFEQLQEEIKKIQDTPPEPVLLSEDKIKSIDGYQNKLKELYAALNLLRTKEMTSSNIDELTKNFPELSEYIDNIDVLEEQIQALINENLILLKKEFDGVISEEALKELSEYTVKMENIDSSINSTVSAIDNITLAYQTLNKAVEEYNENGYVSLQTLEEIIKIKPEYLSAFIDENGKIKSNTDAYKELVKIHLEEYELSAKEAYDLARKKNAKAIKEAAEDYGKNKITLEEYERRIGALGLDDYRVAKEFIKSVEEQLEKNPDSILSPDSSPTSDFEQKIDLASQSITTLQHNLSSLQNALSDVSGYKNQIEAIDNIIKAQGNLYTGYEHSRDLYQKQYENSLNNGILAKHGLSKLVKEKIESGAPFFNEDSIEKDIKFGNISITQQDYENIKDAISWYNKVLEAEENLTKTKSEIDESKMSKYDVLRKKSEAYIDTFKNSQKRITDTIDFNGNKATEEQYNNLILYQMGIRKVLEDRYKYESNLLETLTPETDKYTEQEKLVRECADGLAECDKNIKDWRLDMLRLELEAIDDEIDSINDKIKANQDEIDEKDKLISGAIGILNQEVKVQEGLKDVIQERIDALQEENDEHERALALEKAKYELQRAYSQRTVKLYSGEERGFIYTQDREAVRDAQENLDKLEYEETIHALQEQVGYYDDIIDNLNTIKDSWSNISSAAQEFLEIENVIAKYGVGIKDSILSGSYDTDGLTQSYKGLLHLGEEFDNDLKKQEDLRADIEETIERFQNGTITYEQCLTDIGTLLGKVYDTSESVIQQSVEEIVKSTETIPTEVSKVNNTVKELEKNTKESTGNIKNELSDVPENTDKKSSEATERITKNLESELENQRIILEHFYEYVDNIFLNMSLSAIDYFQQITNGVKDMIASAKEEIDGIIPDTTNSSDQNNGEQNNSDQSKTIGSKPHISFENYPVNYSAGENSLALIGDEELPTAKDKESDSFANSAENNHITVLGHKDSKHLLTAMQNNEWEKVAANFPKLGPIFSSIYSSNHISNVNNGMNTTPVVQNITLTLPNVTNENGYGSLVNVLKSLPLDTVQYTHKK